MKPPRKLHIKSYGCQMNVYDAQRMVDTLAEMCIRDSHCTAGHADLLRAAGAAVTFNDMRELPELVARMGAGVGSG